MARRLLIQVEAAPCGVCWSFVMLHALSAASSAQDLLKALTASKSQSAGIKQDKSPFDFSGAAAPEGSPAKSGAGGGSQISPATMGALLAAQGKSTSPPGSASRADLLKDLFAQIDGDGDGQLSKPEFENALGAGGTNTAMADNVFGKLDKDADGAVSLDEMLSALKGKGLHRHRHAAESGALEPVVQTLLPPVGSTAPASPAAIAATSSYNFIEQMAARDTKSIAAAGSLSISA